MLHRNAASFSRLLCPLFRLQVYGKFFYQEFATQTRLFIWLLPHGGDPLPTSDLSLIYFDSSVGGCCQKLEPTSCLVWGGLPFPGLPVSGGPRLLFQAGLWSFQFPYSLSPEKWLFWGKGMSFKCHSFLLRRELGDSKVSRALIMTPHTCCFASAFILIWGFSAEPPRRHRVVKSVHTG